MPYDPPALTADERTAARDWTDRYRPADRSARSRLRLLAAILLLSLPAACDSPSAPEEPDDNDGEPTLPEEPAVLDLGLEADSLLAHLNYLAGDSLYGREARTQYERLAAEYLRGRLEAYGLAPGSPEYWQTFAYGAGSSQNVIAILPGAGSLAGQWVVLGAHYDHLGYDRIGTDSLVIYNGADDNASGTSLLLELARNLQVVADTGGLPAERRSLMFHAYGAEEIGLRGSRHFCDQPTVPLESVAAMLNFDMVGRLRDDVLRLVGLSSSPDWFPAVVSANSDSLAILIDESSLHRSDQLCFYERGVPVLMINTRSHAEYHTPYDDAALINVDGMLRVGDIAARLIGDLLTRPRPPAFTQY